MDPTYNKVECNPFKFRSRRPVGGSVGSECEEGRDWMR